MELWADWCLVALINNKRCQKSYKFVHALHYLKSYVWASGDPHTNCTRVRGSRNEYKWVTDLVKWGWDPIWDNVALDKRVMEALLCCYCIRYFSSVIELTYTLNNTMWSRFRLVCGTRYGLSPYCHRFLVTGYYIFKQTVAGMKWRAVVIGPLWILSLLGRVLYNCYSYFDGNSFNEIKLAQLQPSALPTK